MLCALTGCAYTSDYTPPDNWRARPIFMGNEVVALDTDTEILCAGEAMPEAEEELLPVSDDIAPTPMTINADGFWVPMLDADLLLLHHMHRHHMIRHGYGLSFGHGYHGGSGWIGGGGGGLGSIDDEAAAVALAVVLVVSIVISSGVAVALAAVPAESKSVSSSIDEINAHNDQLRSGMVRCIEQAAAAPEPTAEPAPAPEPTPDSQPTPEVSP